MKSEKRGLVTVSPREPKSTNLLQAKYQLRKLENQELDVAIGAPPQ